MTLREPTALRARARTEYVPEVEAGRFSHVLPTFPACVCRFGAKNAIASVCSLTALVGSRISMAPETVIEADLLRSRASRDCAERSRHAAAVRHRASLATGSLVNADAQALQNSSGLGKTAADVTRHATFLTSVVVTLSVYNFVYCNRSAHRLRFFAALLPLSLAAPPVAAASATCFRSAFSTASRKPRSSPSGTGLASM